MRVEAGSAPAQTPSRYGATRLYRDAGSIASSNIANAILGVAFWAIAATLFPPEDLGVMTAILAVIMSVGVVVAAGFGDAYAALLPAVGSARPALYRRGQRLFWFVAVIAGACAATATLSVAEVRGSIAVFALVLIGILAWSAVTLQNSTLVALGRARWLPATNILASVGKIALLPLLAAAVAWHAVELAFVISAVAVVGVLRPAIVRVVDADSDVAMAPEHVGTRTFNTFVAQATAASALSYGVITLTPFLVTLFAGSSQGALFALALAVVQALDFVCAALASSLVVHASSAPGQDSAMARAVLIRTLAVATAGSVAIVALAPAALQMLNRQYSTMGATGVIAVLCAGCIVRSIFTVWAGLQKSRRDMKMPLVVNAVAAVILLASMPALCSSKGALGGSLALLFAQSALSVGAAAYVLVGWRRRRWTNRLGPAQAV